MLRPTTLITTSFLLSAAVGQGPVGLAREQAAMVQTGALQVLGAPVRADGNALAVGGYDMIATFPFPETGEDPSDYITGTDSSVRGIAWKDSRTVIFGDVAWSADGERLATGMVDSTVLVWEVAKLDRN